MSLYASCPCGIKEGSNEDHLRTDCPLYGLPPKGKAMTNNTNGAALLPVTPEARKAALDLMDEVGRVRADLYGPAILRGEWDECDELQAFACFERDIIASQSHSLPGDVGMREALLGMVKWAENIMRAHGITGDQVAVAKARAALTPSAESGDAGEGECHGLDTPERVCFYEQDFYVLSNFSSFTLYWNAKENMRFDTSEAAYHWEKFPDHDDIRFEIINAPSAHEAFKIAEQNKIHRRADWDAVKVGIMRDILRAKVAQHEYVRRKLLATGDRELVENSWRDDYWGWGPNRDGRNMLGKLWMEVRAELRAALPSHKGAE